MERTSRPFPIVISGPSGVGKTTLVDLLLPRDPLLRESVSTTTRAPRDDEVPGTHYFFVDRAVFESMKKRELIEWAEVHGELYGTPRRFVEQELEAGRDVILNVDVQGGDSVKKAFPEAVTIFILPPSFATLRERILKRGGDAHIDIDTRLETAKKELNASARYDYLVVNDDLERAVADLAAIVAAERCRRARWGSERGPALFG